MEWIWNLFKRDKFNPFEELGLLSSNVSKANASIHLREPEDTIFEAISHCDNAKSNISRLLSHELDQEVMVKLTRAGLSLAEIYTSLDQISEDLASEFSSKDDAVFLLSKQKHKLHEVSAIVETIGKESKIY